MRSYYGYKIQTGIRFESELLCKIAYVVKKNKRFLNAKLEFLAQSCVEEYEREVKECESNIKSEHALQINSLKLQFDKERAEQEMSARDAASEREREIESLKARLQLLETEYKLKERESVSEREREILELKSKIDVERKEQELIRETMKNEHTYALKQKDEMIEYYKDMKLRASTKMLGESLEQHCEVSFNQLRHMGFRNAYFEKDNDAHTGTKGDYIYREMSDDGYELISIMFEMKNEADATATKKKNEYFLQKLDKDRREKGLQVCGACVASRVGKRALQHWNC